ncbi:hypothetical protein ACHAWF_011857 [Thalassiosira exigua]
MRQCSQTHRGRPARCRRGAEGTVVKDLARGPGLKVHLPEDKDDDEHWDDEHVLDDEELPYEEKILAEWESKKGAAGEGGDAATGAGEELTKEGEGDEGDAEAPADEPEGGGGGDGSEKKAPASLEEANKKLREARLADANKRKFKKNYPRNWEDASRAAMEVIDTDAHPHFEVTADGKILHSGDSEDADSSDDEDRSHDPTTYLLLPNLGTMTADEAAHELLNTTGGISFPLQKRLATMFEKAHSHECRATIAEHLALHVNGLAEETKMPFDDFHYPNTCTDIPRYGDWDHLPEGVNVQDIQYRSYQPDKDSVPEGTYLENKEDLQLLYVILTHDRPEATIRLMESVYVPEKTKFVIHVDRKERADETYERLREYAAAKNEAAAIKGKEEYVRMVPRENCIRVNWGGYTMVAATLEALKTTFGLDGDSEEEGGADNPRAFQFHKLIHLASTTYPMASNMEIRETLASFPLDANFLHIILRPNNPSPSVWNYFVECDDALHRIYRLPALNYDRGNGVDIYTSSQWFIISREFAWYLASPPQGSFVEYYLQYIEHVVVADEAFFGTVLRNTHFCGTLHNDNFLHLQFDRWENEAGGKRDQRKCIMRNPDHCGRSPTTLTVDYLPTLELSGDLFARKFDDDVEPLMKDYIDAIRVKDEEKLKQEAAIMKDRLENETHPALPLEEWEFQGEGVLIVAKETVSDSVPLCMGLPDDLNTVLLRPCFKKDVPPTLSPGWESGAVIMEEIDGLNRWDIGPCSSDGELKRNDTGEMEMIPGKYSERGPSCGIKMGDGPRLGRCLDVESTVNKPGGMLNVFPCYTRWHQLFSFGNGTLAPRGAVHVSLPLHMFKQEKKKSKDVHQYLCLGVHGRGDMEEAWKTWTEEEMEILDPWEEEDAEMYPNGRKSLQLWKGQQLETTPCSNEGGIIEFLFVPFIMEEYDEEGNVIHLEKPEAEDEEEL